MLEGEGQLLTPRSYEAHAVGQQRYAVIESCTLLETLWAKIDSGHWDWLGLPERRGKVTFILGRPRVGGSGGMAVGTAVHGGAEPGQHGVEVRVPHADFRSVSSSWHPTSQDAEHDFERKVSSLAEGPGSALHRVTLVLEGQAVRHQVVARILPNRL